MSFIPRQVRGEHKPSSASFADNRPFRLRFDVRFASHAYEEYALKRLIFFFTRRKTGSTRCEVLADVSTSRESPVVDRRTAREIRGKRSFGLLERWIWGAKLRYRCVIACFDFLFFSSFRLVLRSHESCVCFFLSSWMRSSSAGVSFLLNTRWIDRARSFTHPRHVTDIFSFYSRY